MSHRVFAYGTLLYDEVVEALTTKIFASAPATLAGYRRYRINDPERKAKGPAIVEESGARVSGRVLLDVDAETLAVLDRFELEAGGYERVAVQVLLRDGRSLPAEAYRGTDRVRRYLDGTWSPEEFRRRHWDHYLHQRIPSLRKAWGLD